MPQARLPDINTAYITYRREVLVSLKTNNYTSCIGSLYALNGLLPEKYRITISNMAYAEKTMQDLLVICRHCKQKLNYKKIKILKVIVPLIEGLVSGQSYHKVWDCILCQKENSLDHTEMIQQVLKEPSFLQVVPRPPNRKEGMKDRTTYHNQFVIWAETLLIELEAQMAQFRDDNWHKGDDPLLDEEVDTEGEDEEEA